MNCQNNNATLRRLPAEQSQWQCAQYLLAKGSLSAAPSEVCRGPGKAHSCWGFPLQAGMNLPCCRIRGLSTPWEPPACPPGTATSSLGQVRAADNGSPSKNTGGMGSVGQDKISCMRQHSHHSWSFETLAAVSAPPPSPGSLGTWLWAVVELSHTPDSSKHLNSTQTSSSLPISNEG